MDKQALPINHYKNHTKSYKHDAQVMLNENKTKNNDIEERTRTANKRVHHEQLCKHTREYLKSLSKEQLTELWLPDGEGLSQIWGEIHLERKWVWTLERMGGNGGRRFRGFQNGRNSRHLEEVPR